MDTFIETKIITFIALLVVLLALLEYSLYTVLKTKYYWKTRNEILKLEIILLKSLFKLTIICVPRLALLFLVISLPLIGMVLSTEFFVLFSLSSLLLFKVLSPGLLLIDVVIMHYFLGKYGSLYKLPILFFIRNDTRQFLEKHLDIYIILMMGFTVFVVSVVDLLIFLVDTPTVLSKIAVGIIITLLLFYVIHNKKYEKAINLLTSSRHKGRGFTPS